MIRQAVDADAPRLAEMGLRFMRESHYAGFLAPDLAVAQRLVDSVLTAGLALVADIDGRVVGMLGAMCAPWLGVGPLFAFEVCWWIEPEVRETFAGGRCAMGLVAEYEAWAASQGAVAVQMVSPNHSVARIYLARGYTQAETSYVKRLAA